MDIRAQAELDLGEILDEDGIDGGAILIDPDENAYPVNALYFRVGVDIDPETGALVPGNKSVVSIRLSELGEGVLPAKEWTVQVKDVTGSMVTGKVNFIALDRTLGTALLILRV